MSTLPTAKIVTANDLIDGDVIYLTANDLWSRHHAEAELITTSARAEARLGFAEAQAARLVGAYLADARPGDTGPAPTHFREEFRATGPSNYRHGKHEADANV